MVLRKYLIISSHRFHLEVSYDQPNQESSRHLSKLSVAVQNIYFMYVAGIHEHSMHPLIFGNVLPNFQPQIIINIRSELRLPNQSSINKRLRLLHIADLAPLMSKQHSELASHLRNIPMASVAVVNVQYEGSKLPVQVNIIPTIEPCCCIRHYIQCYFRRKEKCFKVVVFVE